MRIIQRDIIKKEKIKRIYAEEIGWIEKFESDIIVDFIAGEYCFISNWIINKNISILRPRILTIEWNIPVESVDEQIERVEFKLDEASDEIPF